MTSDPDLEAEVRFSPRLILDGKFTWGRGRPCPGEVAYMTCLCQHLKGGGCLLTAGASRMPLVKRKILGEMVQIKNELVVLVFRCKVIESVMSLYICGSAGGVTWYLKFRGHVSYYNMCPCFFLSPWLVRTRN
jgi:hypothetical protein